MKKTTIFILMAMVSILTTACGADNYDLNVQNQQEIRRLTAENERLCAEIERLQNSQNPDTMAYSSNSESSIETTKEDLANSDTATYTSDSESNAVAEDSDTATYTPDSESNAVAENSAKMVIPEPQESIIPSEKENIYVCVKHHDTNVATGIAGVVKTYKTADEAFNNAFQFTDDSNHKYVDFIVSGVTISRVEVFENGQFEEKTDVTFDKSLNQYAFEKCYNHYGLNLFLITTCHGNQYYFAATF